MKGIKDIDDKIGGILGLLERERTESMNLCRQADEENQRVAQTFAGRFDAFEAEQTKRNDGFLDQVAQRVSAQVSSVFSGMEDRLAGILADRRPIVEQLTHENTDLGQRNRRLQLQLESRDEELKAAREENARLYNKLAELQASATQTSAIAEQIRSLEAQRELVRQSVAEFGMAKDANAAAEDTTRRIFDTLLNHLNNRGNAGSIHQLAADFNTAKDAAGSLIGNCESATTTTTTKTTRSDLEPSQKSKPGKPLSLEFVDHGSNNRSNPSTPHTTFQYGGLY